MWKVHAQPDGRFYVQSPAYHAPTAVNLSEGRAQELAQLCNESANLIPPQPAYNANDLWKERVA